MVKDKIRLNEIKKLTLQRKKNISYNIVDTLYSICFEFHTIIQLYFLYKKRLQLEYADLSDKFAYTVLNNTKN